MDAWELMRTGKTDLALRELTDEYAAHSRWVCTREAMRLGAAYLWLADYGAAFEHFQGFNERYPHHASVTYAMAGAAKWCLNAPEEAADIWREGLDCAFAHSGVNTEVPLLLVFAAVVRSNDKLKREMEELLAKRLTDSRAKMWPGPLAEFVLDWIDEQTLFERCQHDHPDEALMRTYGADFYIGVVALACGNRSRFLDKMTRVGTLSWDGFDSNRNSFLTRIWHSEFFIARHEAGR